ncbi:DUF3592 domain-containing protein [Synechococcus sp. Cruz CV-v-12]|uniref:DUF3592 domain-containing protein n=1 Tax=Synechococcus sp. Cruz CV-v-12 TaxID=2823728 RepID=UPI0020CDC8FD|nr:DUF3592 domain-containing protein [Synechococcus sp. Cruz CV-v-12]MCP9874705.1 DUF3592 domain-containing protein [Synechococcus sp. Cruz CV-v-12]
MDIIMRSIFILMLGGLAAMLISVGIREFFRQRALLAAATPVEAEITHWNITRSTTRDTDGRLLSSNSTTTFLPEIKFAYTVGDVRYESDMLYPTVISRGYADQIAAGQEIADLPLGARVMAYVDPSHPDRAFLRASASAGPLVFALAGLATLGLLVVLLRVI